MAWYLDAISRAELLTAEEELKLARSFQNLVQLQQKMSGLEERLGRKPSAREMSEEFGVPFSELQDQLHAGVAAREKLLISNLRLVVSIAKRFLSSGMSLEDLIQAGNMGLIRAAERFEPERKYRFTTYATYWIKQGIHRCIREESLTIRLPSYLHDFIVRMRQTRRRLSTELGRAATDEELAQALDVSLARVTQINELPSTTSLDVDYDSEFRRGSRRRVLSDLLAAPNEDSEAHVEVSLLRAQLEQVLKSTLTPQQRDVLRLRYGLDDGVAKTMRDVGAIAGLQPFTVRQLEKTALARLRRQKVQEQLKEFIPVDV